MAETEASPPRPVAPRDRYPRMILVCMAISAVLSVVIGGAVLLDFVLRSEMGDKSAQPPAMELMLEAPREAYTEP